MRTRGKITANPSNLVIHYRNNETASIEVADYIQLKQSDDLMYFYYFFMRIILSRIIIEIIKIHNSTL